MNDSENDTGARVSQDLPEAIIDGKRRSFASLLALFGGGAALSACVPSADATGSRTSALTGAVTPTGTSADIAFGWVEAAVELRAKDGDFAKYALAFGSKDAYDGGHGLFKWFSTSTTANNNGTVFGVDSVEVPGRWHRVYSGPVNVRWFTAVYANCGTDGGVDCPSPSSDFTLAAAAALTYLQTKTYGGTLYFPEGVYDLKVGLTITDPHIHILGDGAGNTRIQFNPTSDAVMFNFDNGTTSASTRLLNCSIRGLQLGTSGTNTSKTTAVRVSNADNFTAEDLVVFSFNTYGGGSGSSIGLKLLGGQFIVGRGLSLDADLPISIEAFTSTLTVIDHCHLSDLWMRVRKNTEAAIGINSNVVLQNLIIDGDNSSSGGKYGFKLDGGTSTGQIHAHVAIKNYRSEQFSENGGYTVYVNPTGGEGMQTSVLHGLYLENVACGIPGAGYPTGGGVVDPGGIYVRYAVQVSMRDVRYRSTTGTTLNLDSSCSSVEWFNLDLPANALATLTGLVPVWSTDAVVGGSAIPTTARYMPGTTFGLANRHHTGTVSASGGTWAVPFLDGSGTYIECIMTVVARASVGITEGCSCVITLSGILSLGNTSSFAISDVASKVCVVWNPTTKAVSIKNNMGYAVDVLVTVTCRL